jgi:hypothetical protein
MTSNDNFFSRYKRYEQTLAEANVKNKETLFDALSAADITRIEVTFNGEGDSGQIEEMTAFLKDKQCGLPAASVSFVDVSWDKTRPSNKPLRDVIESLCYDYLSQEHGGWENDDGAFGEFTFHVAERTIELDFNSRYTDSTTYSHTF